MSVAIKNSGTTSQVGGQASPYAYVATISSGATCALLSFYMSSATGNTISAVALSSGESFTHIGTNATGAAGSMEYWGFAGALTAGTPTVTITWSPNNTRVAALLTTWTGNDTSSVANCFKNFTTTNGNTATSPSVAITSAAGDVVVGIYGDDSGIASSITLHQTAIDSNTVGRVNGANYNAASAGSTTLTADFDTSTKAMLMGIAIKAAGGGGGFIAAWARGSNLPVIGTGTY